MMIATFHNIPVVAMPYVEEEARKAAHRETRRLLMLDVWKCNRWLYHQDFLARLALSVEESQPAKPEPQPEINQTFTYSAVAFHGWRKLAWYLIGLLDNVSHVWRIAA